MVKLGVNIDHVATVREARKERNPDPVAAALAAELAGAHGITAHLREDLRHMRLGVPIMVSQKPVSTKPQKARR